jgi:Fic family protein
MLLLNEISQLQEKILQLRPLKPAEIKSLREYYKIGITYSSNALEGNSLTESETKVVIEDGITIGGKPIRDHLEALGHADAYNYLWQLSKNSGFSEKDINKLHQLFFQRIDQKNAGKYRKIQVFISGSEFIPPKTAEVPKLMKLFVSELSTNPGIHPVEWASKVHLRFVQIHPYIDGNGRIARLLLNLCLLQNGFPVTIIPPILRLEYISSLEKAHKNPLAFCEFVYGCVKQSQLEYLRLFQ